MLLSQKQIALFGQVKVIVFSQSGSRFVKYRTLLEIYKAGWWATERFGTIITLVKKRKYAKDGFSCVCKRIVTDVNLDALDVQIHLIADRQYEKYKRYLQSKTKYNKWGVNEDDTLSVLRTGN